MSLQQSAFLQVLSRRLRSFFSAAAIGASLLSAASASAASIVIDDFNQPNPQQFYVIAAINADPLLHKTWLECRECRVCIQP